MTGGEGLEKGLLGPHWWGSCSTSYTGCRFPGAHLITTAHNLHMPHNLSCIYQTFYSKVKENSNQ